MSVQMSGNIGANNTGGLEDVKGRNRWVAGVALVALGVISLVANFVEIPSIELLIVPALGAIFLLWGLAVRQVGLLVPGGILSGIGLGLYLMEGPLASVSDETQAGAFLLAFALGWGLITVLSVIASGRIQLWPLIPGGIMALIGGALIVGGTVLEAVTWVGRLWPLGLIAFGLYLVLRRSR